MPRQCERRAACDRYNSRAENGNRVSTTTNRRQKVIANGGISLTAVRATTALLPHRAADSVASP